MSHDVVTVHDAGGRRRYIVLGAPPKANERQPSFPAFQCYVRSVGKPTADTDNLGPSELEAWACSLNIRLINVLVSVDPADEHILSRWQKSIRIKNTPLSYYT